MALIKSINDNHKDLAADQFFHPNDIDVIKTRLQEGVEEWFDLAPDIQLRTLYHSDTADDDLRQIWSEIDEKKLNMVLVGADHDWERIQIDIFNQLEKQETFVDWLVLYNTQTQELINPLSERKVPFHRKILGSATRSAKRTLKQAEPLTELLSYLVTGSYTVEKLDQLLEQGKVKEEKLENWKERLKQAKMWDEDEEILDIAHARLRRNHYTINSNFNRSGKIVVTNKRIIFARRSFSIFGLSAAAIVPLLAFARPANKIILLGRTLAQYLRVPFKILRPILSGIWPVIAGLAVSINFIDFQGIRMSIEQFLSQIPSVSFLLPALDFAVENPWVIASLGGMSAGIFAGLRFGLFKLFFRRDRLIILPHDQLSYLLADGVELVGRWKVKGHSLVRAEDGIQYRLRIYSHNEEIEASQLAQRLQVKILESNRQMEENLSKEESSNEPTPVEETNVTE